MRKALHPLITTLIAGLLPATLWAGPVDINTADAATLAAELDGIGLSRAEAIVEDRERNGPFAKPDDLARVKGVGLRIVDMNRGNIRTAPSK